MADAKRTPSYSSDPIFSVFQDRSGKGALICSKLGLKSSKIRKKGAFSIRHRYWEAVKKFKIFKRVPSLSQLHRIYLKKTFLALFFFVYFGVCSTKGLVEIYNNCCTYWKSGLKIFLNSLTIEPLGPIEGWLSKISPPLCLVFLDQKPYFPTTI